MTPSSLATVFGPPLSGAGQNNALLLEQQKRIGQLVVRLVRDYPYVFRRRRVPPEAQAALSDTLRLPLGRALYEYEPLDNNELPLRPGQLVVVTFRNADDDAGWYQGYALDATAPLAALIIILLLINNNTCVQLY
mmetsp:Transcript_722/g.1131  ORF Transcript_722/g.1131 Transcript_722/m.1131 type:complete len:135 (+) Transcript_722:911-1315(+)